VFGGLNRLPRAVAVAGVALLVLLAAPTAALACNNSTSAGSVYHECLPSSGGGGNSGKSTGRPSQSGKGGSGSVISGPAAKAVARAGKESRALALVESTRPRGVLRSNPTSSVAAEPSAVGSAFDLGSGPGAFLIALAGAAVLLLGGSGLRVWRHRRQ
jgi:hypothetical protein